VNLNFSLTLKFAAAAAIPSRILFLLLVGWEKDASGRYEHKTLINLMKSSSPWLLPGEGRQSDLNSSNF